MMSPDNLARTVVPAANCTLIKREGGIAEILFDTQGSKVNKLDTATIEEFYACIREIAQNREIKGVLIRSKKLGTFIAGADIALIQACREVEEARKLVTHLQGIFDDLSRLPVPTVAAIDGPCLGGGCELALACQYRIATSAEKTQIGLPEVNLGVIPGAGGTQRLPDRVGYSQALTMILSGKPVNAKTALKIGLVDKLVSPVFFDEEALAFVRLVIEKKFRRPTVDRGIMGWVESTVLGRRYIFRRAERDVLEKTKGHYPAPLRALEAVRMGADKGMGAGLQREAEAFAELAVSPGAKNLIRIFFGTEAMKKETGLKPGAETGFKPDAFERVAVIGAGIMGGGIAYVSADKGMRVRLKDISSKALLLGVKTARDLFAKQIKRRKLTPLGLRRKMHLLSPTLEWHGFKSVTLVIEAVVEKLDVKQALFQELERRVSPKAVLATNTSSLSVEEIGVLVNRKERVAGLHFFNPVPIMQLVEVVRSPQTSDETVYQLVQYTKRIGKFPVVVKDRPGFLVNRILCPYLNEAGYLYMDGAGVEAVDRVAKRFGLPMGPFRLLDEIGLDTAAHVSDILERGLGERMKPVRLVHDLVQKNLLGKKGGKGFYVYERESEKEINPELPKVTDRTLTDEELIRDRLILIMVNEAARCLDEEIVDEVWKLDFAMVMATGFPPFRGGVCAYADSRGVADVVERLNRLSAQYGPRFAPAERLQRMARSGERFFPVAS